VTGGYTPAARWLVTLRSTGRAFVKLGTTAYTAEALRLEWQVYSALTANFMPGLIAWDDHPAEPMLALEDLSTGFWPPRGSRRWSTKYAKPWKRYTAVGPPEAIRGSARHARRGLALRRRRSGAVSDTRPGFATMVGACSTPTHWRQRSGRASRAAMWFISMSAATTSAGHPAASCSLIGITLAWERCPGHGLLVAQPASGGWTAPEEILPIDPTSRPWSAAFLRVGRACPQFRMHPGPCRPAATTRARSPLGSARARTAATKPSSSHDARIAAELSRALRQSSCEPAMAARETPRTTPPARRQAPR